VQILVEVAIIPTRTWKAEVEKGLAGTALDCQSAVPKPEGSSASMQHYAATGERETG